MPIRQIRKLRAKKKLNFDKPALVVFRSNKNISIQVLEATTKNSLTTISSSKIEKGTKTEKAQEVGKLVAKFLKGKGIDSAIFYRNGYVYHGRIQAAIDSVRENGISI